MKLLVLMMINSDEDDKAVDSEGRLVGKTDHAGVVSKGVS
jgi:hypothetical protein